MHKQQLMQDVVPLLISHCVVKLHDPGLSTWHCNRRDSTRSHGSKKSRNFSTSMKPAANGQTSDFVSFGSDLSGHNPSAYQEVFRQQNPPVCYKRYLNWWKANPHLRLCAVKPADSSKEKHNKWISVFSTGFFSGNQNDWLPDAFRFIASFPIKRNFGCLLHGPFHWMLTEKNNFRTGIIWRIVHRMRWKASWVERQTKSPFVLIQAIAIFFKHR